MSEIFYSQVDANLQEELNARGRAGKIDRTTKSLDYMLGKIANVELIAYKNQEHKLNDPTSYLYKLGGREVASNDFLPAGYLKPNREITLTDLRITDPKKQSTTRTNNTHRVPPFITSCNVSLNDHTMGTLNSATINITIPNPDNDLDFMESTFARPGRAVTLKIEHPDSAVITGNKLTGKTIKPDIPSTVADNNKINTVTINALVISFEYSYQSDASILLTLHLRGTSNVFTDVSLLTNPDTAVKDTEKLPDDFYKVIYDAVLKALETDVPVTSELIHDAWQIPKQVPDKINTILRSDVNAFFRSNQTWDKKERYYIQLGLLVDFINYYILSKQQKFVPNAYIICNNNFVFSNYYEHLISANPDDILIIPNQVYGKDAKGNDNNYVSRTKFKGLDLFTDPQYGFTERAPDFTLPSRIYINLDLINSITTKLKTNLKTYRVNDLLSAISTEINTATGGAINLQLISYPDNPDYLLFYDANFLGDKKVVIPYSVPMMANHRHGTIVRDFKFSAKLPSSMQGLMYTINNSDTISEEQIAPYMNFMYNNSSVTRVGNTDTIQGALSTKESQELQNKYRASHDKYLAALKVAIQDFANAKGNTANRTKLQAALTKYIQYPKPSIEQSNQMQAPVYPYEVDFTIDGINGFRYGDVLEFNMLPSKYRTSTTFSIISISHSVTTAGDWTTNIKCIMRPRFD